MLKLHTRARHQTCLLMHVMKVVVLPGISSIFLAVTAGLMHIALCSFLITWTASWQWPCTPHSPNGWLVCALNPANRSRQGCRSAYRQLDSCTVSQWFSNSSASGDETIFRTPAEWSMVLVMWSWRTLNSSTRIDQTFMSCSFMVVIQCMMWWLVYFVGFKSFKE